MILFLDDLIGVGARRTPHVRPVEHGGQRESVSTNVTLIPEVLSLARA